MEPDTPFRIECNLTNIMNPYNIQWYHANKLIHFDNSKYSTNWTALKDGSIKSVLYVNGLSLSLSDSQEIDFACSVSNNHITNFGETSILLRSKFIFFNLFKKINIFYCMIQIFLLFFFFSLYFFKK